MQARRHAPFSVRTPLPAQVTFDDANGIATGRVCVRQPQRHARSAPAALILLQHAAQVVAAAWKLPKSLVALQTCAAVASKWKL